jgi:DUF1365 family protein
MFCLDLEEIDSIAKRSRFISRNAFNLFSFRDSDHLRFSDAYNMEGVTVREKLRSYLRSHDLELGKGRVLLVTHLRTLGYIFNPVSFYFCYDEQNEPLCVVVEVCNTFREMKLYFLGKEQLKNNKFHLNTTKYFYVSPFIELDTNFDFHLDLPGEKLNIRIDDIRKGERFFISTLTGRSRKLTDARALYYFFRFPLITLRVIGLIHWEAFRLWIKRIPYYSKRENVHLQKGILNPKDN